MAVPDFQSLMLPIMEFAADGQEHSLLEVREHLAKRLGVTEQEREELLPSGRQAVFDNRFAWAKTYLQQAGLLNSLRRGFFRITDRGRQVLADRPSRIDVKLLRRFPEFVDFHRASPRKETSVEELTETQEKVTPEEMLEAAYQQIRNDLAADLLGRIKASPPSFFERLVVELLVKMGYGGSRREAGKAIGRSGDEGIDGEDRLGLDSIYVQAKRWEGTVGRPEIQRFVGALHGKRARKGSFLPPAPFRPKPMIMSPDRMQGDRQLCLRQTSQSPSTSPKKSCAR